MSETRFSWIVYCSFIRSFWFDCLVWTDEIPWPDLQQEQRGGKGKIGFKNFWELIRNYIGRYIQKTCVVEHLMIPHIMEKLLVLAENILCNWVLNEADTFKTSSTLIYWDTAQSIYAQMRWCDATLIKIVLIEEGWEIVRRKLIM